MIYYTVEQIGPNRSLTPEGYLLCKEVPIARTGEMLYASTELPTLSAGRDGIIHVMRSEADVLTDETRASFEGKPVVDDHPNEDVTSKNWRDYACGTVQNVRKNGSLLVADMLITVDPVIAEVMAGKREVSCGYTADYEQTADGFARQFNIVGNHVAIVRAGRCGPQCAIGDSKMAAARKTRAARILEAVTAGDADALEDEMSKTSAPEIHVHNHIVRDEDPDEKEDKETKTEDEEPESKEEKEDEKEKKTEDDDPLSSLNERMDRIEDSVTKMRDAIAKFVKDEEPEGTQIGELEETGASTGNLEEIKDPGIRVDGTETVGDSRDLVAQFRETISVAEILAPGIGIPTFDAKASSTKTIDAMCGLRRRALTSAFADTSKREIVAKVLAGRKPDFAKMTCDAVYGIFVGAGALVRDANNRRPYQGVTFGNTADRKTMTVADFQAKAAEMWARK